MYYKTECSFVSIDKKMCKILRVKIPFFAYLMCASSGMSSHRFRRGQHLYLLCFMEWQISFKLPTLVHQSPGQCFGRQSPTLKTWTSWATLVLANCVVFTSYAMAGAHECVQQSCILHTLILNNTIDSIATLISCLVSPSISRVSQEPKSVPACYIHPRNQIIWGMCMNDKFLFWGV